jgi:uncharacterized membrane protein
VAAAPAFCSRLAGKGRESVLALGIGLIALGLLLLVVPGVGFLLGPVVAAAGVVLLVLHFVRASREPRTR